MGKDKLNNDTMQEKIKKKQTNTAINNYACYYSTLFICTLYSTNSK